MAATYLALLRGINVGGKNLLPMKDLVGIFVAAGGDNVRTFIQSGNVIFEAAPDVALLLPDRIATQIAERFGFRAPVVLRTTDQLQEVIRDNPFRPLGAIEETLHVMFLADLPRPDRVASLDPDRSPPDVFIARGREVYLQLPHGVARTRLTNSYFDAKLATTSTLRNWRTVTRLVELMGG